MEKKITAIALGEVFGKLIVFFIEAAILLWVCAVLLPAFPWLACLAGLTYWDWVAVNLGIKYVCRLVGGIFHPAK